MKTFLFMLFAGACSSAVAQTPAANPMPDGSRKDWWLIRRAFEYLVVEALQRAIETDIYGR